MKPVFSDALDKVRLPVGNATSSTLKGFGLKSVERWTQDQVHFSSQARIASRRSLFYLKSLEPDSSCKDLEFVFDRVINDQLGQVHVPPEGDWCSGDCPYTGSLEDFAELSDQWNALNQTARAGRKSLQEGKPKKALEQALKLEGQLADFIKGSTPGSFGIRWTFSHIPRVLELLSRNLGLFCAVVLGLVVALSVEAVRSLAWNRFAYTAWAFLFVIAPFFVLRGAASLLRRANAVPPWDRGGRAFHAWKPVPLQPQTWIPWPAEGSLWPFLKGRAIWISLYAIWWAVGFFLVKQSALPASGTVYLIIVLIFSIALLGRTIDFLDFHSPTSVRLWLLIGALLYVVVAVYADRLSWSIFTIALWAAVVALWSWQTRQVGFVGAAILLAGFGIVALVVSDTRERNLEWTSSAEPLSYLENDEWPFPPGPDSLPVVVMAASGGGSRAAIYTAKLLEALHGDTATQVRAVSANIHAISSVSGGSLANAVYLVSRLEGSARFADSTIPACPDRPSVEERVAGDFLWPTILGALLPWRGGRGSGIEQAWAECPVGLGTVDIADLQRSWRQARAAQSPEPPFPVPMFNSVTLERHAVVITPLARSTYESRTDSLARFANEYDLLPDLVEDPMWVYYRGGIYGLDDLLPGYSPTMVRAVRASANFPFGFPLVNVKTDQPLYYNSDPSMRVAGPEKEVQFTDGGALSNSGLWSLVHLLLKQEESLRGRGVLLLIVDANKMSEEKDAGSLLALYQTVLDKNPKGEALHRAMLDRLRMEFGSCFQSVHVELVPGKKFDVHTTWALDDRSLRKLDESFEEEWPVTRDEIVRAWNSLISCNPDVPGELPQSSRVPIN